MRATRPAIPLSYDRRQFLGWVSKRGLALGVGGAALSTLAAACGNDGDDDAARSAVSGVTLPPPTAEGGALVGDVLDYALTSDEWEGAFGFVTFRMHQGSVDGAEAWFIRTDASDEAFAEAEKLVWVPRLAGLVDAGAAGALYEVSGGVDGQPVVLSSEPGRDDYTPAWRVHRARWTAEPSRLASVADVEAAADRGDLSVDATDVVVNASMVKWSNGELPVDAERKEYLGPGQLLEPPDTAGRRVMFKLHECFPESRYIVTDTGLGPMAEGMRVGHSPRLAAASTAKATGRTNVFMNGLEGPGPMGFQPSVFDARAGDPVWSPYWDHFTYGWKRGKEARLLTSQDAIHDARDAGDLDEFPGSPETDGAIFAVNCPVPVVAANTFTA